MRASSFVLAGLLGLGGIVLMMAGGPATHSAFSCTRTAAPGEDGRDGETLHDGRGTRDIDALTSAGSSARFLQCRIGNPTRLTRVSGSRIAAPCGGAQSPPATCSSTAEFTRGIDNRLMAHGTRLRI